MATLKARPARRLVANTLRLIVPAGAARPAPPVGPILGQYRLNLMAFCKDFNAQTQKYKPDIPMQVVLYIFKDNSHEFFIKSPSVTWLIKKAAGIETASARPGHEVAGTLTLKHIYEIAKVKQSDPFSGNIKLESFCKCIIETCKSMGIKVVRNFD